MEKWDSITLLFNRKIEIEKKAKWNKVYKCRNCGELFHVPIENIKETLTAADKMAFTSGCETYLHICKKSFAVGHTYSNVSAVGFADIIGFEIED